MSETGKPYIVCQHDKLQTSTIATVLEELARIKSHAILKRIENKL